MCLLPIRIRLLLSPTPPFTTTVVVTFPCWPRRPLRLPRSSGRALLLPLITTPTRATTPTTAMACTAREVTSRLCPLTTCRELTLAMSPTMTTTTVLFDTPRGQGPTRPTRRLPPRLPSPMTLCLLPLITLPLPRLLILPAFDLSLATSSPASGTCLSITTPRLRWPRWSPTWSTTSSRRLRLPQPPGLLECH